MCFHQNWNLGPAIDFCHSVKGDPKNDLLSIQAEWRACDILIFVSLLYVQLKEFQELPITAAASSGWSKMQFEIFTLVTKPGIPCYYKKSLHTS